MDFREELQILTGQVIDGLDGTKNKISYARLSGMPLEISVPDDGPTIKRVDVKLTTER